MSDFLGIEYGCGWSDNNAWWSSFKLKSIWCQNLMLPTVEFGGVPRWPGIVHWTKYRLLIRYFFSARKLTKVASFSAQGHALGRR